MPVIESLRKITSTRETSKDGLTRCEIVILLLMVAYSDKDNLFVATADQMAEHTGYTPNAVRAALHTLLEQGYVAKEQRSVYRLPDDVLWAQNPSARGILPTAS